MKIHIIIKKVFVMMIVAGLLISISSCSKDLVDPFAGFTYDKEEETIETKIVVRDDLIINKVIFGKSIPLAKVTHYYSDVTGYLKEYKVEMLQEVKAGDVLAVLDSGTLDKEFRDQAIAYEKAKLKYEKAKLEYESSGYNENAMLSAKLDFEYEELKYNNLLEHYKALEIRAEIDGVVTKRQAYVDDFITAKSPIADITDSSEILISFDSGEAEGLRIGDVLEITIRNSDDIVMAEIIEINGEQTVMRPEYIHDSFSRAGALVYVNILEDMRLGALLLDDGCIVEEAGRNYVYIVENGEKSERDIKIGLSDKGMVEILFGLEEGEVVVYNPH